MVGGGEKVKITLNGKPSEVEEGISLSNLLAQMKIEPQKVACEVNQKIIKRAQYASTNIAEGDAIEILQMIGGG